MGIFDFLKKPPKTTKYALSLNGYSPIFSQFGTDIYASDVVQQALKCIVDEIKKLNPMHVRKRGLDTVSIKGDILDVLRSPNQYMTTTEMLEKICYLLLMNYNAFIVPTYYTWTDEKTGLEKRYYTGLYPIQPIQVDFIEDASNTLFVKFTFANSYTTTLKYSDVIHIKYNYSVNEYMGGGVDGQPNHSALLQTLELNKTLLTGVAKALKASYAVNGVVKYNTLLDDGSMRANLNELEEKLKNNESAFLPLDIKSDFTPITRNTQIVDNATLKFVDEKILRHFGVPLSILSGDYTKEQYEAFYQKTLEPIIISFSQAFTKTMFTAREKSFGNEIAFYPKSLIFMTVSQTLEMINILSPTGGLMENEKRVALGLSPLPELEGKRFMSLNWIDANSANTYQVGKDNEEDKKDGEENGE